MEGDCPCPYQPDGMTVNPIRDPERLAALRRLSFLDTRPEPEFDRITCFATSVLKTPTALLTLVDDQRQWFKSCVGLPEPWATVRETPLSHSFCRFVVAAGRPLGLDDARRPPLGCDHPAIEDLGLVAYLGAPLRAPSGAILGAICVGDSRPRQWSAPDMELLGDLAAWATAEIERRDNACECRRLEEELAAVSRERATHEQWERVTGSERSMVSYLVHEISTPLTVIQGYSTMIRDEPLSMQQIKEFATDICDEAALVSDLISRSRDPYRAEATRTPAAEINRSETAMPPPAARSPAPPR
jgi:GAF domain-containing protein/phospho-acceptor domain-containing protein